MTTFHDRLRIVHEFRDELFRQLNRYVTRREDARHD